MRLSFSFILPGRIRSALFIHLADGRIDAHFYLFGSLAFLAFYRDGAVLLSASLVVAAEQFVCGAYWAPPMFGILHAGHWRWLQHAGWVIFEDIFLFLAVFRSRNAVVAITWRQASLEAPNPAMERRTTERPMALKQSQERYMHLVENATEIMYPDGVGRFIFSNAATTRLPLVFSQNGSAAKRASHA